MILGGARFSSGSTIDGSERDIFQLQFPHELTLVTPGVCIAETRVMKRKKQNERKREKQKKREQKLVEKKNKWIDVDIVELENFCLWKIEYIDQNNS